MLSLLEPQRVALDRDSIEAEAAEVYPNAQLEFRSWVSASFIRSAQNPEPEVAGIRTAIFGSLWVLAFTILFAFPVGVAAAIYLEEYATDNRVNRLIRTNINNWQEYIAHLRQLASRFVRVSKSFTSGRHSEPVSRVRRQRKHHVRRANSADCVAVVIISSRKKVGRFRSPGGGPGLR